MTFAMSPAASWAFLLTLLALWVAVLALARRGIIRASLQREDDLERLQRDERAREAMRRAAIAAGAEILHDPRTCGVCRVIVGERGPETIVPRSDGEVRPCRG